jgi:ribonucleoside-triphosphate reductase
MFENSSIVSARDKVVASLDANLSTKALVNPIKKVETVLLDLQGISDKHFDFLTEIEEMLTLGDDKEVIDQTSNKQDKVIEGAYRDATDSIRKLVGFRFLYRKLKELYGKEEALRLTGRLYSYDLAISDSTKLLSVYCYSLDCTKLVIEGKKSGNLVSAPPKRLQSYMSALVELIHELSSHMAGAIAVGTFFLDSAHMLLYKEGITSIQSLREKEYYIKNVFETFLYSVNHLSRNAVESPFTNISIFDKSKLRNMVSDDEMGWYFPKGDSSYSDEAWKEFVVSYIMEIQKIFLEYFNAGSRTQNGLPFRFPVVTLNFSKSIASDGTITVDDTEFLDYVAHNLEIYRYNIFISEGTKVASCCRLLSDTDMLAIGAQSNSFGGSGVSLGSHRVVTINFNRLALEAESYDDYKTKLEKAIDDSAKILKAHKDLLKDIRKYGYIPFVDAGYIRFDRLFSTLGVLGLVEAQETMKTRFNVEQDIIGESLVLMNSKLPEIIATYKIIPNIEQIPAESMAVKVCNADKSMYGEEAVPYTMYSNQFIPLWKEASIFERMDIDGKYNKLFTGGGIVHFNLGEKVTPQQVERLISYAITAGSEHFALNSVYNQCENNHYTFGKYEKCPVCGGTIIEQFTRIVGFFVPVSKWNKTRRTWEFPKRVFKSIEE